MKDVNVDCLIIVENIGGVFTERVKILLINGCWLETWVPPVPPSEKKPLLNVLIGLTPSNPVAIPPAPPHEPQGK